MRQMFLSVNQNDNVALTGKLDVGPSQAQSILNTYFDHFGSTDCMMMEGIYRDQGFLHFETNYQYGDFNC